MSYDIYVLEENAITISGGVGLDGVTQGDGSHLPGQTITLNAPSCSPTWKGLMPLSPREPMSFR